MQIRLVEPCTGWDSDMGPVGPTSHGTRRTPALSKLWERDPMSPGVGPMGLPHLTDCRSRINRGLNLTTWFRMNPAKLMGAGPIFSPMQDPKLSVKEDFSILIDSV